MCEKNNRDYPLPSSVLRDERWQDGVVLRKLESGQYCRIGTFQSEAEVILLYGLRSIHYTGFNSGWLRVPDKLLDWSEE